MNKKSFFYFFLFVSSLVNAQITGTVTNNEGEFLPYVNIYQKDGSKGTTTNTEGKYRLDIEEAGTNTLVFQFLGYQTREITKTVDRFPYTLDVTLKPETTVLAEIVLDSRANPADEIIRRVIANKSGVLEKYKTYTADFYSRGLWKVKNAPERILGRELGDLGGGLDSTRTGIVYLSETISKIAYRAPADFKETIIASKISGDDNGFSFNSAQEADFSFYRNTLEINNQIVSPLADNAFNYYNYKLAGSFYDGKNLIDKIQVKPKRKNDRVFNGYIYIAENDWQLYGAELITTGAAIQVPFIDSLKFTHNFKYDEEHNLWIKSLQTIDFSYELLGFKGDGRFTAVYSNYDFNPDFDRKSFNAEVLSFKPQANKKDSTYWLKVRPVPLSLEERTDYVKKDSLQELRKSEKYLDSVDVQKNRFKIDDPVMGYSYTNSYDRWRLNYEGLVKGLAYSTIQGWNAISGLSYSSWTENYESVFNAGIQANYGLADERFRVSGGIFKRFNRTNRRTLGLQGGNKVEQFNSGEPISRLSNSLATILWERNYLKAYELTFARIAYSEELFNGFRLNSDLGYEKRDPLFNSADHVFIDHKKVEYTSNNPLDPTDFDNAGIDSHEIYRINVEATINFGQKYMSYPDGKFNIPNSRYPQLKLGVEQGFAASRGELNFTEFNASLSQEFDISNKGTFGYNFRGGTFLNAEGISFVDFQHFKGKQTRINLDRGFLDQFNLLPYYAFSTNESYFEGHLEHNFKGFILAKVPGIRRLNLNLVTGARFLVTGTSTPYGELSVGLDNLGFGKLRIFRVDYVRSFHESGGVGTFIFGIGI